MKVIRQLIREIHDRSVWQVLGIYLAASWVALEVTGALAEAANLPGWFPTFALALLILGLPVVLATAIVQHGIGDPARRRADEDGVPAGRPGPPDAGTGPAAGAAGDEPGARPDGRREPSGAGAAAARATTGAPDRPDPDRGAASVLTWRNAILGGVAALALWAVVATVLLVRPGATDRAEPVGAGAGSPSGAAPRASVAVLPLDNLSSRGSRDDYIAEGLHDEILTRLQQAGGLLVKSRTSVLRYRDTVKPIPEIAEELAVDAVVEGSLRREGDRIRITAQLIDGDTDDHLWADSFDRVLEANQLMAVQGEVALAIADALRANLTPAERDRIEKRSTEDPAAQRSYLLGLYYHDRGRPGDLERAVDAFDAAIAIDPEFAKAYAARAETYMVFAHTTMPPWQAFPRGEESARRALLLDDDLARAHTVLADVRYHYDWDWDGAEQGFRRAIALNPNHATAHWWYAGLLSTLRRHQEAVRHVRMAQERDPTAITYAFAARVLMWAGRPDLAVAELQRGLDANPAHPMVLDAMGLYHTWYGDGPEAGLRYLDRAAELGPGPHVVSRAIALAEAGREEEARAVLERLEAAARATYVPQYGLAGVYAALGRTDDALDALERSAEDRDAALIWVHLEPRFRPLHDEPRFRALVERLGL